MHRRRTRAVAGIGLADALGDDLIALDQRAVRCQRTHRAAPAADAKAWDMAAGMLLVHEAAVATAISPAATAFPPAAT